MLTSPVSNEPRPALLGDLVKDLTNEGHVEPDAWQRLDRLYLDRSDYALWRTLEAYTYLSGGGRDFSAPSWSAEGDHAGPLQALRHAFGDPDFSREMRIGLLATVVDWLCRRERWTINRQHKNAPEYVPEAVRRRQVLSIQRRFGRTFVHVLADAVFWMCSEATGPSEAGLAFIGLALVWPTLSHSDRIGRAPSICSDIERVLKEIDDTFTFSGRSRAAGLAGLDLEAWRQEDGSGGRALPAPLFHQLILFGIALQRLSEDLRLIAEHRLSRSEDWAHLVSARSVLQTSAIIVFTQLRKQKILRGEPLSSSRGLSLLYLEADAARAAAEGAEEAGDWLRASKLWVLVFMYSQKIGSRKLPQYAFRMMRDMGMFPFGATRQPGRESAAPRSSLLFEQYSLHVERCRSAWERLEAALRGSYEHRPWDMLQSGLNFLAKSKSPASSQEEIHAGFTVALTFRRVELCVDFLELMESPKARDIVELAHIMRLALQWGSWAIDFRKAARWREIVTSALLICQNFEDVDGPQRFYFHEIMGGRIIKLRAGEELERTQLFADTEQFMSINQTLGPLEPELSRSLKPEHLTLAVGLGEIRVVSARKRLMRLSPLLQGSVAALSLYIFGDNISYVWLLPEDAHGDFSKTCGVRTLPGLSNHLAAILSARAELSNMIHLESGNVKQSQWKHSPRWSHDIVSFVSGGMEVIAPCLNRPLRHVVICANEPFTSLPWQHLIAVATTPVADDLVDPSVTPSVSIMPSLSLMTRPRRPAQSSRRIRTGFVRSPSDEAISEVVRRASDSLAAFSRGKHFFGVGLIVGHTVLDENGEVQSDGSLPLIYVDDDVAITRKEFLSVLEQDVVILASCRTGAPLPGVLGDVGAALSAFFMSPGALLLAPVADASPGAGATLIEEVLKAGRIGDVMAKYLSACRRDPAVLHFNMYGVPLVATIKRRVSHPWKRPQFDVVSGRRGKNREAGD